MKYLLTAAAIMAATSATAGDGVSTPTPEETAGMVAHHQLEVAVAETPTLAEAWVEVSINGTTCFGIVDTRALSAVSDIALTCRAGKTQNLGVWTKVLHTKYRSVSF